MDAANAQFNNAQNNLRSAQASVNSIASQCRWYDGNCHWYEPWNCALAGGCWAVYGVSTLGLTTASAFVNAAQATVNVAYDAYYAALAVAQAAVNAASATVSAVQYLKQQTIYTIINMM